MRERGRDRIVRLALIVAVIGGIALFHGMQCADGTMTHVPVAAMDSPGILAPGGDTMAGMAMAGPPTEAATATAANPRPDGAVPALIACLTLLVAVLVVCVGFVFPRSRTLTAAHGTPTPARAGPVVVPSLRRPCVLRT